MKEIPLGSVAFDNNKILRTISTLVLVANPLIIKMQREIKSF